MLRRTFLTGIAGVIAAPAIVRASSLMPVRTIPPTLWGDGIHDDTAALQWLLNSGKPVKLVGGTYRISNGITGCVPAQIENCSFILDVPQAIFPFILNLGE